MEKETLASFNVTLGSVFAQVAEFFSCTQDLNTGFARNCSLAVQTPSFHASCTYICRHIVIVFLSMLFNFLLIVLFSQLLSLLFFSSATSPVYLLIFRAFATTRSLRSGLSHSRKSESDLICYRNPQTLMLLKLLSTRAQRFILDISA